MEPCLQEKLAHSVTTFGLVENLVVRPKGEDYEVISGTQRLRVYAGLGMEAVPCVVVQLDDSQAMLLAQVLNRTRGEDDLGLKAELFRRVMDSVPQEDVLSLLPETADSLEKLSTLGSQDLAQYLQDWETARAARLQTLQMRLTQAQLELVEEALAHFIPLAKGDENSGPNIRGTAFYLLCKAYLEQERGLP